MAKLRLDNFSLGLVSPKSISEGLSPAGTLVVLKNARLSSGEIKSPKGMSLFLTLPTGEYIEECIQDYANKGHYVATSRHLYHHTDSLGWRLLKANCFSGRPQLLEFKGKVFACDGVNPAFCLKVLADGAYSEEPIIASSGAWASSVPEFFLESDNRLWVMFKDSNEVWHSALSNGADYTISSTENPASANVFISGDAKNRVRGLCSGFGSVMIFKDQGVDYIQSVVPGSNSALDYRLVQGYLETSTYNPFTVKNVRDKVFTLGYFGLQMIDIDAGFSSELRVYKRATAYSDALEDGFRRDGERATLLATKDSKGLMFDTTLDGERIAHTYEIEKDTVTANLSFPGIKLVSGATDFNKRYTVIAFAYKNMIWFSEGGDEYPTELELQVKTPHHPLGKGKRYLGQGIEIECSGFEELNAAYSWDDMLYDTGDFSIKPSDYATAGGYGVEPYGEVRYATDKSLTFRRVIPLTGRGQATSLTLTSKNVQPGAIIKSASFLIQLTSERYRV